MTVQLLRLSYSKQYGHVSTFGFRLSRISFCLEKSIALPPPLVPSRFSWHRESVCVQSNALFTEKFWCFRLSFVGLLTSPPVLEYWVTGVERRAFEKRRESMINILLPEEEESVHCPVIFTQTVVVRWCCRELLDPHFFGSSLVLSHRKTMQIFLNRNVGVSGSIFTFSLKKG